MFKNQNSINFGDLIFRETFPPTESAVVIDCFSVSIITLLQYTVETFPCFLTDMNKGCYLTFPSSLIQTILTAKNIVIATGGRPKYPTNVSNFVVISLKRFRFFSTSMCCLVDWLPGRQTNEKETTSGNRVAKTTEVMENVVWRHHTITYKS